MPTDNNGMMKYNSRAWVKNNMNAQWMNSERAKERETIICSLVMQNRGQIFVKLSEKN